MEGAVAIPMTSLIEVRPLEMKTWHGKTGKESFRQARTIEALFDKRTGGYATGLTEGEVEEYGKRLGGVDLSNTFSVDVPHPFWSTKMAQIKLENHTMILDTTIPLDYVKSKVMKASKYVANSMKEWEEGLWPDASHVIFDEVEQVALKASKIEMRERASGIASKMSLQNKINILLLLSKKSVKNRSQDYVTVELDEVLNTQTEQFLKLIDSGTEEVAIRATITDCLQKNILTKEAGSICYMGEVIAMDFEDAIIWFKDPNNSIMKVRILEKLKNQP